ncbi:uncharacterized protein BX663DRAFT_501407 [Cokeromyces recurvatus]|uniref:uncharacterized protein n=1 Tax=Cokeromyces recurvatus TaxID=90255 RepID=UPI00221E7D59|nr:uncharacterized protein BX663DRAFT_501407 [Cokeromyces recurvatus]KAI7905026.1 hypothetical protein BX663DRAFT_501407 [Cokeromyces recurvatus]
MESQAMPGFVFLDFPDRKAAEEAYNELKKINFGLYFKQVFVEYAKPNPNRQESIMHTLTAEELGTTANPISESQGILYPPNPHLKYYYPDPTPAILTNMMYAIGSVPRLYTQVLHLMNKLNMPPPFGFAEKEAKPSILKRKHDDLLSSDESEIEDDTQSEEISVKLQEEKVKQARLARIAAEKQKLAIKSANSQQTQSHQHQHLKQKLKIVVNNTRLNEEQKAIRDKCKPLSELIHLSAFKNYEAGEPSSKLYIKNLSKKTTQEDLIQLFSKFSKDIVVDLKSKGRLRDQAFISFQDPDAATLALECTNGYVLLDRPIAVLYSRGSKQKEERP